MPEQRYGATIKLTDAMFHDLFEQCCGAADGRINFNICVPEKDDVDWFLRKIVCAAIENTARIPVECYDTDIGGEEKSGLCVTFITGSFLTIGTTAYWCRTHDNNWACGDGLYTLLERDEMDRFRKYIDTAGLPFVYGKRKIPVDKVDEKAFDSYIDGLVAKGGDTHGTN